jgi:hypothetical protein
MHTRHAGSVKVNVRGHRATRQRSCDGYRGVVPDVIATRTVGRGILSGNRTGDVNRVRPRATASDQAHAQTRQHTQRVRDFVAKPGTRDACSDEVQVNRRAIVGWTRSTRAAAAAAQPIGEPAARPAYQSRWSKDEWHNTKTRLMRVVLIVF